MNRRMLDQIGGDISTFQSQSFRLNALNRSSKNLQDELAIFKDLKQEISEVYKFESPTFP